MGITFVIITNISVVKWTWECQGGGENPFFSPPLRNLRLSPILGVFQRNFFWHFLCDFVVQPQFLVLSNQIFGFLFNFEISKPIKCEKNHKILDFFIFSATIKIYYVIVRVYKIFQRTIIAHQKTFSFIFNNDNAYRAEAHVFKNGFFQKWVFDQSIKKPIKHWISSFFEHP